MTKKIDYNKWHSGPPPSLGWWPASVSRFSYLYRWWDGKEWSKPVGSSASNFQISEAVAGRPNNPDAIEWQHRPASWPKRSRT